MTIASPFTLEEIEHSPKHEGEIIEPNSAKIKAMRKQV
jgi:hypothetical protein